MYIVRRRVPSLLPPRSEGGQRRDDGSGIHNGIKVKKNMLKTGWPSRDCPFRPAGHRALQGGP